MLQGYSGPLSKSSKYVTDGGSNVVSLGIPEFFMFFPELSQCPPGCIATVVRVFAT